MCSHYRQTYDGLLLPCATPDCTDGTGMPTCTIALPLPWRRTASAAFLREPDAVAADRPEEVTLRRERLYEPHVYVWT